MNYQGQYQQRPKTQDEIQQLHDMLHPLANREIPLPPSIAQYLPMSLLIIRAMLFTLCWVLGHTSGSELHHTIQALEKELDDMGYELRKPVPGDNQPGTHFSIN